MLSDYDFLIELFSRQIIYRHGQNFYVRWRLEGEVMWGVYFTNGIPGGRTQYTWDTDFEEVGKNDRRKIAKQIVYDCDKSSTTEEIFKILSLISN